MTGADLAELADFLRRSRERIDPLSVGLAPTEGERRLLQARLLAVRSDPA